MTSKHEQAVEDFLESASSHDTDPTGKYKYARQSGAAQSRMSWWLWNVDRAETILQEGLNANVGVELTRNYIELAINYLQNVTDIMGTK